MHLSRRTERRPPPSLYTPLPAGVFGGLDSLEVLDLSGIALLSLPGNIFGGLSNLVELDLSGTLLQRNSVPVGVFDGLHSLEILRIRNAGYEGGGINLLDDDIFRDLDTLRELDVRPSKPHQAAPRSLMPLTPAWRDTTAGTTTRGSTRRITSRPPWPRSRATARKGR